MVKTFLVSPDIELGSKVLHALDAAKFPLTVALWLFEEERGSWNLIVATPLYDRLGPKEAYGRLIAALSSQIPRTLSEIPILLESNRSPLIKGLRRMFGKTASVDGMRLGGQSIGSGLTPPTFTELRSSSHVRLHAPHASCV
jgi:hypothetical protein